MKEYIERAVAIEAIRKYQYPYGVEFLLSNIPAADVSPVRHGRWEVIRDPYGRVEGFLCECGHQSYSATKYCPNCGARMDKEDEHEAD